MHDALFEFVTRTSRSHKRLILLGVDLLTAPLALMVTFGLLYNTLLPTVVIEQTLTLLPAIGGAAVLTSVALGLHRIKLKAYESRAILKTALFSAVVAGFYGVLATLSDSTLPGAATVLFGIILFLMSVATRFLMLHFVLWIYRRGRPRVRVLIYGAGTTGMQLATALRTHETIDPVAFVDDNPGLHQMTIAGLPVYPAGQIGEVVHTRAINRVLLAMPSASTPKQAQIARRLQSMGLDVLTLPSFAQLVGVEELVDQLAPVRPGRFLGRQKLDAELPAGAGAYTGRNILVTGAGGSIGSELCRQLLTYQPARLVLFDVSELALYNIDRDLRTAADLTDTEIVPVLGSVTDARVTRMVMTEQEIDVVLHAAAYKHVPLVEANPLAGLANNVLGTRTLADVAGEAGVKSFILISTDKAVRPANVMGASKRLAEMVVQDLAKRSKDTVFSMVRFGNVLGSSGSVVPLFHEQIAKGGPVTLTHEDVSRYFMTIGEAARLVLLAGSFARGNDESRGGDVFVLDMGEPVKIRELARQMIEDQGYTVRDADNPDGDIEIVTTGLRPGEKLTEELLIGEGLLTTPHPKILRAEESSLSELEVAGALRALRAALASGDSEAGLAMLRRWVDGYQPGGVPDLQKSL
ncbi:polysaccharide biosynthesis protein [Acidimangrovimonas pyrenivorans]|uniref:Polysaccharide biosynthesis protein n=1 Tax=Acidimangrovimonas pyrenivorans TaxID=2030798 RepID=A0ABV7ACE7_9RHOB